jgi:signal transduction histidine kinase
VRVACLMGPGGVEIVVHDTGVGISAADLDRLGKPFEQVAGEHVRSKEGTGLGLALVKALAGMHGGDAVIESEVGEGTTVRVHLPHAAVDDRGQRVENVVPFRAA